ncbi:MAG: UDP-glucose/GDP-mannose dehydrogenase family protein [Thermomicrobiales bacterium]
MQITLFGTGYVGLVTGACFAAAGNDVVCVDIDAQRVSRLQAGECPIFEPRLQETMNANQRAERLIFTTDAAAGIAHGDVIFICVGTPPKTDGSSDLSAVESVARSIGKHLNRDAVVVNKSTVPVGTGDHVESIIRSELRARRVGANVEVVSNPEFLKEGAAMEDFQKPDRIVIGTDSDTAISTMRALYAPFNRNHNRLIVMDRRSAEFTKYAANAILATKISFMNEMANIAERIGVDIESVRVGIGSDPRIGYAFIYPGAGYGGSCFPKDVQSIEREANRAGYDAQLLRAVNQVNERQKDVLFTKIDTFFAHQLRGKTIAVWGLSFKPNTDDMREAPSRALMEALWSAGAVVRAYDPAAMNEAARIYSAQIDSGELTLVSDAEEALTGADALAICTEWREFQMPDYARIAATIGHGVIFDGRNILDRHRAAAEGLTYIGIGLGENGSRAMSQTPVSAGSRLLSE